MEKAAKSNITVSTQRRNRTGKNLLQKRYTIIPIVNQTICRSWMGGNSRWTSEWIVRLWIVHRSNGNSCREVLKEVDGGTLFLWWNRWNGFFFRQSYFVFCRKPEVSRVGLNKIIKIDVRVIIATHKILLDEVQKRTFPRRLVLSFVRITDFSSLERPWQRCASYSEAFVDSFCKDNKMQKISFSGGSG